MKTIYGFLFWIKILLFWKNNLPFFNKNTYKQLFVNQLKPDKTIISNYLPLKKR